jgi:hypothetical protein
MEKDIKEISGQVSHMRDTKDVLTNIKTYQEVLSAQIEYALRIAERVEDKVREEGKLLM